jgi:hypothetical protein
LRQGDGARAIVQRDFGAKSFPQCVAQVHVSPVGRCFPIQTKAILDIQHTGVPDPNARYSPRDSTGIGKGSPYSVPAVLQCLSDRVTRRCGDCTAAKQVSGHVRDHCRDLVSIDLNAGDMGEFGIHLQQGGPAPARRTGAA